MTIARPSAVAFIEQINQTVPEVRGLIEHTRRVQGEILPHIEMAELTRWLIEVIRNSGPASPTRDHAITRFLSLLENQFQTGDQDLDDLIGTSFLENIDQAGDDVGLVVRRLPRKLLAWYSATQ